MADSTASRFSTLKVFQFSKSKPPTPPPKDPYYLSNRSLTSLAPDPLSLPYRQGSSQSTMSLVSSAASLSPSQIPLPTLSKKGFFKFAKRVAKSPLKSPSLKSSASFRSLQPPQTPDDDGISAPWNFQHHIHVDESYAGMPPSWSASLAEAGFSPSEIAAIRDRRTRSPSSYLYLNPPQSPAQIPAQITQPAPRTTSLPRQYSNESTTQSRPPLPTAHTTPMPLRRKRSSESTRQMSDPSSSSVSISREMDGSYVFIENRPTPFKNGHAHTPSVASRASSRSRSRASSNASTHDLPPLPPQPLPPQVPLPPTPPRPSGAPPNTVSPPPPTRFSRDKTPKQLFSPPNLAGPSPRRKAADQDSDDSPRSSLERAKLAKSPGKTPVKKLTSLPPRLSLHDDSDLSSWSEALISAIPAELSAIDEGSATSPVTSKFAQAQAAHISPSSSPSSSSSHSSPPSSSMPTARPLSTRRMPPQRPVPPIVVKEYPPASQIDDHTPQATSTPMWDELLGMVRQPESAVDGEAEYGEEGVSFLSAERDRDSNRDSSRSSVSTVTHATIVRNVSVAKRAVANVIQRAPPKGRALVEEDDEEQDVAARPTLSMKHPGSPQSSHFSSEDSSGSSSSQSHDETLLSEAPDTPVLAYLEASPLPKPSFLPSSRHTLLVSATETFGGADTEDDTHMVQRPTIVIAPPAAVLPAEPTSVTSVSPPVTPAPRYRGWLSQVVKPLEPFIDEFTDPREHYVDLQEIAEGESGSVYAARVIDAHKLKLPAGAPADADGGGGKGTFVAIKNVPILPAGSAKLSDLRRELALMQGVRSEYVLGMDALYVDLVEDSLWIRMELMERSLADVVALVSEGLMVQERMMARFASDVLMALAYLQTHRIAHRDLRSDNLLINRGGILKITDFSNAVRATPEQPMCADAAGVIYWQAPEVRMGPYDPLKVDVWSLGATIWEMAEAQPPFANVQDPRQIGNRWPPLTQPEVYSRCFHEFLRLCSQPSPARPSPHELSDTPFIRNACGRQVIIHTLSQCRAIEERMLQGDES